MKTRTTSNESDPAPRKKHTTWRRILVTLVVLLITVILLFQYGLGLVVRNAAKAAAPSVIGTEVTIEKAYVRPFFGIVDLGNLVVGPPTEFKANVFEMKDFRLILDPKSVFTDTLIIKEIAIINPLITYELSGMRSNISAIMEKLKSEEEKAAKDSETSGKKVIIESFIFSGAKIRIATTATGGKGLVIPMPDILLRDIGKQNGGVTALDAFGQTMKAVSLGIFSAVKNIAFAVGGVAVDGVKAIGGAAINTAAAAGNAAVDTASAVGNAAVNVAGAAGKAVAETAGAVGGAVTEGAKSVGSSAASSVKAIGGAAADTVGTVGGAILSGARTVGGATIDTAGTVGGAVFDGAKSLGGAALDTAGAVGGAAVGGAKAVGGAVAGGAKAVGGAITGMFDSSDKTNKTPTQVEKK